MDRAKLKTYGMIGGGAILGFILLKKYLGHKLNQANNQFHQKIGETKQAVHDTVRRS